MKLLLTLTICALFLAGNSYVSGKTTEFRLPPKLADYLASKPEYVKTKAEMMKFRAAKTPVVGVAVHRAANEFAPENTLAAMQIALDLEVDYIEMDVRQTKDCKSLILHDGNLDRTTNGKGPLKDVNFDEARALSAGLWFDPFYASEKIPTLEESCALLADHNKKSGHKTYFYVDCKDINAKVLIDNLIQYHLLEGSVLYINKAEQIDQIRAIAPKAKILPGLRSGKDLNKIADTLHPYALDVNWKDLSKELIDKAHAKGVKIFSDGFGEDMNIESYQKAIKLGIDVISTNKVSVIYEAVVKISK
ncbi:MAG: glycerophosphodiester phosphodiesterase family protein [Prolixibacteraceae bacterium]|jgi:glycerophosphoryl diester phosphodiesterase|nr:glycerophosphodiester phosphodiesterase family protein [Prolixibacteraceae bacterium]